MNHDPGVPKAAALSFGTSTKKKGTHACCKANAHGVHIRLDVLHGVENAETVVDRTPWRVDVQINILLRIFRFKEKHLGNDSVGRIVGDRFTQEDDAFP